MRSDVVVIGAGVAGCALANFLSAEGVDVVLVDKDYPGLGATGRSAGLVTQQHWSPLDVTLARESREIVRTLLGSEGLRTPGLLRATTDAEDVDLMEERFRAYRRQGINAQFIAQEELSQRFPPLNTAGLKAGILTPDDGYVDAYDLASAMAKRATEAGATIRVATRVEALEIRSSKVLGVRIGGQLWEARVVVVSCGAWSQRLLETAGIDLPLKAYRTQALVTAPVDALPDLPMFHELPDGLYFRPERDGILMGDGTEHDESSPEGYNTHADFEFHARMAQWISSRVPALEGCRIARGWAGLCVATPDRMPLAGQVEAVEGLFVFTGFNGLGVMRAPSLARHLADILVGRAPGMDMTPFHPSRFEPLEDFTIREGFSLQ